jgi:malic enzyme
MVVVVVLTSTSTVDSYLNNLYQYPVLVLGVLVLVQDSANSATASSARNAGGTGSEN